MALLKIECDGCGRKPNFWEWVRGELSADGYSEWRHPGIVFKQAGCPLAYENRSKAHRLFTALYGHPLPEELSYLCPECQILAEMELPALLAGDLGDPDPGDPDVTQQWTPRW